MAKSIAVLFLFVSQSVWANNSSSFTQEELKALSPFEKSVQVKVLHDVLRIMKYNLDKEIEVPEVRISESVTEEDAGILKAAESQGMPAWAFAKGINMYLLDLNVIILGKEMKLHNLAHEFAHYVQLKYGHYPESSFGMDYVELEAVNVQWHFRFEK